MTGQEKINILIVDDREENLIAMEAILSSADYHLIKAHSGREALRYLLDHSPALILMDVQMPGLDGFETARLIKQSERSKDIPIIFITAINVEDSYVEEGYGSGAVDYIFKPYNPFILKSKVAVFVELYRSREELRRQQEKIRQADRRELEHTLTQLELKSLRRERTLERRYQDLIEGITNAVIWSADPASLQISFVSPSAESILAYHRESWLDQPGFLISHIHPEDRGRMLGAIQGLREEGDVAQVEHRFLRAGGGVVWFRTNLRLAYRAEGAELELRGLSVDVSTAKEAENALRGAEERSRLLARASYILAQSLEPDEVLAEVGSLIVPSFADWYAIEVLRGDQLELLSLVHQDADAKAKMLEYRKKFPPRTTNHFGVAEVIRTGSSELYREITDSLLESVSDGPEHLEILKALGLRSSMVVPLQARGRTFGGITLISTLAGRQYTGRDLEIAEDLARRIALAMDNADLYAKSQEAIRARDEFLSIASHELKTPLTSLKLQIQMAQRNVKTQSDPANVAKLNKVFDLSGRQVERLSDLVEDLLDVARIQAGKLSFEFSHFKLCDMIDDVLERFQDELSNARCTVKFEGDRSIEGAWDRPRLEQIVCNLISNSIKYAPGALLEITAEQSGDRAILRVQDKGPGIDPEKIGRIFERFERASSSRNISGLGLGLFITKQIAEAHGGSIRVESALGQGSTFIVDLPLNSSLPAKGLSVSHESTVDVEKHPVQR